ncbi:MAG TPA: hypothetical protein DF427_00605 [Moraxellaceae bacterium]|nr:hypothetical protein [Moraxellaceae bacterium]
MTAMLSKLFRTTPKWQSIKSQKRIEAIGELSPDQGKDLEILTRLAKEDSEPAVRREAVKKLHDFDILMQIQKRDLEAVVRDAAGQRLHQLMAGQSPFSPSVEERLQRLERINSPQALIALTREADPVEIRIAAIAALHDDMYLHDIALHSPVARLRQVAAERITTPALLEELAAASRQKDKTVYRLAKGRLDELHAQEKAARERDARAVALCESMEAQARAALNPLYAAKTESLRQQWAELDVAGNLSLAERFATAHALACKQLAEVQAQEQRVADENQAVRELQGALETLEETLSEYHGQDDFDQPSLAAVRKTQRLRWELAVQLHSPTAALSARYETVMKALDQLESLLVQWHQDRPVVEATIASLRASADNESDEAANRQSLLDVLQQYRESGWPLPAMLQDAAVLLGNARKVAESASDKAELTARKASLQQQLDALEVAITGGNSREASRRLRQAQEFARTHHVNTPRLQALGDRVKELKSWAGFVVQPKKEALLAEMQALASIESDPDDMADRIKALQDEWKALGVADPSVEQPLWEQFKAASDVAYEPCRKHFAAQREVRAGNLIKREQLCHQLEQYSDALTGDVDWKNHEAIIQTARREWQLYFPVDRQPARTVQDRFHSVLQSLEARLEAHWATIGQEKQLLVEQAQKLVSADDLRMACDKAKELQQQWRELGQASPRHDRKLWKEFRAACDAVFKRRDDAVKTRKDAQQEQLNQAELLAQAMEKLALEADDSLHSEAMRLEESFQALSLGRDAAAVRDRFQKARKSFDAVRLDKASAQKSQQTRHMVDAWVAVCSAEQALIDNLLPLPPDLAALPAVWRVPLQGRLQNVSRIGEQPDSVSRWQSAVQDNTKVVLDAIMDLELALEMPSPASRAQERRQRQLALLQEKGLRSGVTNTNELRLQAVLKTGPVEKDIVKEAAQRLQEICSRIA